MWCCGVSKWDVIGLECRKIWSSGTSFTTSPNLVKRKTVTSMSSTLEHGNGASGGSPMFKRLRPWEIAVKSWHTDEGRLVDVEHATDAEFQQLIERTPLTVLDQGIAEWSFDDRCGVVNYARKHGVIIPFETENNSEKELFEAAQPAQEA